MAVSSTSAGATTTAAAATTTNTTDATLQSVTQALISTTRSAARLASEDLPFHRSLDRRTATSLDQQNERLLALARRLLSCAVGDGGAGAGAGADIVEDTPVPRLRDVEALDTEWRGVVDVVDGLLERADVCLDEFSGAVRRLKPGGLGRDGQQQQQQQNGNARAKNDSKINANQRAAARPNELWQNLDLDKPQKYFDNVPGNDEKVAFKPILTSKPHASLPLSESIKAEENEDGRLQYLHPYEHEIESYTYPDFVYENSEPISYRSFEAAGATFVDTLEGVHEMLAELKKAREIAVDLEHHDTRSYIGIVPLMQISTRDRNWVVDTLKPWRRKLECLNEVFCDPNIVKVLHGSFMDIVWLQRDFGLYVVGLFDTHEASRVLGYLGGSLAFLLQKFVNFTAQKQYQMADWRIRPLPEALFDYARSDTHFLLYIYDCIRNDLIDKSNGGHDSVQAVLKRSKEKALKRYEYHFYDDDRGQDQGGWYRLLSKLPKQFTKEQYSVFRAVHRWRDGIARSDDDSTVYVMPNHVLPNIARSMPEDKATLFRIAQQVSPTMRQRADELLKVIARAKVDPNAAEMLETLARLRREEYAKFRPHQEFQNQQQQQPRLHSHIQSPSAHVAATNSSTTRTSSSAVWTSSKTIPNDTITAVQIPTPVAPRCSTSAFWGPSLPDRSAQHQQQRERQVTDPESHTQNQQHKGILPITLAIPLPQLTASIFVDPNDENQHQHQYQHQSSPKQAVEPGARAEHAYIPASERQKKARNNDRPSPEIFTIKSLGNNKNNKSNSSIKTDGASTGTKRKATAEVEMANGADHSNGRSHAQDTGTGADIEKTQDVDVLDAKGHHATSSTDIEETLKQKKLRRQQQQRRDIEGMTGRDDYENENENENVDEEEEEEEAFDYANAPSVMYPSADSPADEHNNEKAKGRKSKSKTGIPPSLYARAADAKTSLRRTGQGKGKIGRSGTFAG